VETQATRLAPTLPAPSAEDVTVTREIVAAGTLLGIELLDHLVIGSGGRWVSQRERGLGFGAR
jgi:DNA repair protein RadC